MGAKSKFQPFPEIWQVAVIEPLNTINTANGYGNDLTVLDGWLNHYLEDIKKGLRGRSFPAVVGRYDNESIDQQRKCHPNDPVEATCTRNFTLEIVVAQSEPETLLARLDSVLIDVKNALTIDTRLTLTNIDFIFSQEITGAQINGQIKFSEKWEKQQ